MVLLIGKIKFRIELELKGYKCDIAKDGSDYLEFFISLYYNIVERSYKMEHLPNNIQISINKFVLECKKILGRRLKKIILYGSYARRRL